MMLKHIICTYLVIGALCTSPIFSMEHVKKLTEKVTEHVPPYLQPKNNTLWWIIGFLAVSTAAHGITHWYETYQPQKSIKSAIKTIQSIPKTLDTNHPHLWRITTGYELRTGLLNSFSTIINFVKKYPIITNFPAFGMTLLAASTLANGIVNSNAGKRMVGGQATSEQKVELIANLTQGFTHAIYPSFIELMHGNQMQNLMKEPFKEQKPKQGYEIDVATLPTIEAFAGGSASLPERIQDIIQNINYKTNTQSAIKTKRIKTISLTGDPGLGKTTIARYIGRATNSDRFFEFHGADVIQMYIGQGATKLREFFEQALAGAYQGERVTIFLDECESIKQKRHYSDNHAQESSGITLTLLEYKSKIVENNDLDITLIEASNEDGLSTDQAVERRNDISIKIGYPQELDRSILAKQKLRDVVESWHPDFDQQFLEDIAKKTDGFTPDDFKKFAEQTALLHTNHHCPYIDPHNTISLNLIHEALLMQINRVIERHQSKITKLNHMKRLVQNSNEIEIDESIHSQSIKLHKHVVASLEQAKQNICLSKLPHDIITIKKEFFKKGKSSSLFERGLRFEHARQQLNKLRTLLNTSEQNKLDTIIQLLQQKTVPSKKVKEELSKLSEQTTLLEQQASLLKKLKTLKDTLLETENKIKSTQLQEQKLAEMMHVANELEPLLPEKERGLTNTINSIQTINDVQTIQTISDRINTLAEEKATAQQKWETVIKKALNTFSEKEKANDDDGYCDALEEKKPSNMDIVQELEHIKNSHAIPEQAKITTIYTQLEPTNDKDLSEQDIQNLFKEYKEAEIQEKASILALNVGETADNMQIMVKASEPLQNLDLEENSFEFNKEYETTFVPLEKTITQKFDYMPGIFGSLFGYKAYSELTAEERYALLGQSYYLKKNLCELDSNFDDDVIVDLNHFILHMKDDNQQKQVIARLLDPNNKQTIFNIINKKDSNEEKSKMLLQIKDLTPDNENKNKAKIEDIQAWVARTKLFNVNTGK
jgi:hypothetical protein